MIKIGTSGYSFKDWVGTVYPENIKQEGLLSYYQKNLGFDCVEINSTYYTLLGRKIFESLNKKTDDNFEFVVKGYRGFTHDPFDSRIEESMPTVDQAMDYVDKFIFSLEPLLKNGKLNTVLLQFPIFFTPSVKAYDYLIRLKEKFQNINLAIEFRNVLWSDEKTFDFLKRNNLCYCIVDEPKLENLVPFLNKVTSDIAYMRLHGRNENWFNVSSSIRYDYLYSDEELKSFIPEVKNIIKNAKKLFVFFNNCHMGKAVKNALKFKEMLQI